MTISIKKLKTLGIEIRFFNNKKCGGTNSNCHDNCVELTHVESGVKASSTEGRDRKQNLEQAYKILLTRIEFKKQQLIEEEKQKFRKDTHEVRVYNWKRKEAKNARSGKAVRLQTNKNYLLSPEDLDELIESDIYLDICKKDEE